MVIGCPYCEASTIIQQSVYSKGRRYAACDNCGKLYGCQEIVIVKTWKLTPAEAEDLGQEAPIAKETT